MSKIQQIYIYYIPPKYPKPPYNPAAWNYDNVVGKIWLEGNPSGYDNSRTGQIEVREPISTGLAGEMQGGIYDNRA